MAAPGGHFPAPMHVTIATPVARLTTPVALSNPPRAGRRRHRATAHDEMRPPPRRFAGNPLQFPPGVPPVPSLRTAVPQHGTNLAPVWCGIRMAPPAMSPRERDESATHAKASSHDALLDTLLAQLDAESVHSARLTPHQAEELDGLRDELVRACRKGETERARRIADMAVAIARRGSPVKE